MGRGTRMRAALLALLVAGCGGGGGGGPSAGVQVVGGGTTPTPTPSPAASPSPTIVYDRVLSTTANTQFVGIGGTVEATAGGGAFTVASSLLSTDDGIVLALMPAVPSAVLGFAGERSTYDPLVPTTQGGYTYSQGASATQPFLSIATGPLGTGFAYVSALYERREETRQEGNMLVTRERARRALYGAVTRSDDLPAGSRTYAGELFLDGRIPKPAGYTFDDRPATFTNLSSETRARVVTDLTGGTVTATIATVQTSTFAGQTPVRATLSLSGRIDARGWVTGTITSPDSGYGGRFVGRFYGPQGVELGLFVELSRADGTRQIGFFAGLR